MEDLIRNSCKPISYGCSGTYIFPNYSQTLLPPMFTAGHVSQKKSRLKTPIRPLACWLFYPLPSNILLYIVLPWQETRALLLITAGALNMERKKKRESRASVSKPNVATRVAIEPMSLLDLNLEMLGLLRAPRRSHGGCTSLLLIGSKASTTAPITTAVASSRKAASAVESSTSTEASTTAAPAHAWDVGALGCHLDVAPFEHALVKDEGLGDQAGLGELDIGVPETSCVSDR